ncbi:hypothetical protein HDU96_007777 [Phlyctochytrium bullatum]|nr:hypothetical protein HDU96_007777 [Phlyctochytrium bullatum]
MITTSPASIPKPGTGLTEAAASVFYKSLPSDVDRTDSSDPHAPGTPQTRSSNIGSSPLSTKAPSLLHTGWTTSPAANGIPTPTTQTGLSSPSASAYLGFASQPPSSSAAHIDPATGRPLPRPQDLDTAKYVFPRPEMSANSTHYWSGSMSPSPSAGVPNTHAAGSSSSPMALPPHHHHHAASATLDPVAAAHLAQQLGLAPADLAQYHQRLRQLVALASDEDVLVKSLAGMRLQAEVAAAAAQQGYGAEKAGQQTGEGSGTGKSAYSNCPPAGYVCKLCLVEGHWLKNCSLYREKRRDTSPACAINPFTGRQFLLSNGGEAKYLQNSSFVDSEPKYLQNATFGEAATTTATAGSGSGGSSPSNSAGIVKPVNGGVNGKKEVKALPPPDGIQQCNWSKQQQAQQSIYHQQQQQHYYTYQHAGHHAYAHHPSHHHQHASANPYAATSPSLASAAASAATNAAAAAGLPPPESYVCKICAVPGHWIWSCPKKRYFSAGMLLRQAAMGDPDFVISSSQLKKISEIGSGGYGVIYLAEYGARDVVAVKKFGCRASAFSPDMIQSEIKILSQLHNPCIIKFLGVVMDDEISIVMEYMQLGNLHHYYENKKIEMPLFQTRLDLAYDVAFGMQYLHSRNPYIVHNDLKSPNILLYWNEKQQLRAKIADFGLSKKMKDRAPILSTATKEGTPIWKAPEIFEQQDGKNPSRSTKTDVYSFGVLLTELSSWKGPFGCTVDNEFEMRFDTCFRKNKKLPKILHASDVPEDFKKLCHDCLNLDPAQRPEFVEITERLRGMGAGANGELAVAGNVVGHSAVTADFQRTPAVAVDGARYLFTDQELSMYRAARSHPSFSPLQYLQGAALDQSLTRNGTTRLHIAARYGEDSLVYTFLDRKASVEAVNSHGETPVFVAAREGHVKVLRILADQENADLGKARNDGRTPLHEAVARGHKEVVKFLLRSKKKVDINVRDQNGDTPLILAEKGRRTAVIDLFKEVPETFLLTEEELTAYEESRKKIPAMIRSTIPYEPWRILLQPPLPGHSAGILPDGETRLHIAARFGLHNLVIQQISSGGVAEFSGVNKRTPLHWAAWNGHVRVLETLIEKAPGMGSTVAAAVSASDDRGLTPLILAASNGHVEVIRLMLKHGVDVNSGRTPTVREAANMPRNESFTALHAAAKNGHLPAVRLLLDKGAAPLAQDTNGWTSLHFAVSGGHVEVARFLLSRRTEGLLGACTVRDASTAIHIAAESGFAEAVALLVDSGASPESRDASGSTPMHRATEAGAVAVVRRLLDLGASLDVRDTKGRAPLHVAAYHGRIDIISLLLDKGADVNVTDPNLWTPMHFGALNGQVAALQALRDGGGNVHAKQKDDKTPLDVATVHRKKEAIQFLESI